MKKNRAIRTATPDERARHARQEAELKAELPELLERNKRQRRAMAEQNVSGQLRRAIAADGFRYEELAAEVGIETMQLVDFMSGDALLSSATVDRLAELVHQKLVSTD